MALDDRACLDLFENFSQIFGIKDLSHALDFPRCLISQISFVFNEWEKLDQLASSGVFVSIFEVVAGC